ncbi:MAG: MBL fold metallo-hydrolase [Magnetospirillum sp.]|nr:MBL fold metallo-hydrolase [Magnetospirillum sp.]
MKVRILGCGSAGGVPCISRGWGACDPAEPRNRRRRPSILVENDGTRILVDTSPDLREQLLDAAVNWVDAILYTHDHADHLHGIDDLREVNRAMDSSLPVHAAADVIEGIRRRFAYVEGAVEEGQSIYKPMLDFIPLTGPFSIGGISVTPLDQDHGYCRTSGFRFGNVAYSTDLVDMPDETLEQLHGLDLWVVGCLTYKPHPTHAHLDKVLAWIEQLRPRKAVLTHMTPSMDYRTLLGQLPPGVEPAYDGLEIVV